MNTPDTYIPMPAGRSAGGLPTPPEWRDAVATARADFQHQHGVPANLVTFVPGYPHTHAYAGLDSMASALFGFSADAFASPVGHIATPDYWIGVASHHSLSCIRLSHSPDRQLVPSEAELSGVLWVDLEGFADLPTPLCLLVRSHEGVTKCQVLYGASEARGKGADFLVWLREPTPEEQQEVLPVTRGSFLQSCGLSPELLVQLVAAGLGVRGRAGAVVSTLRVDGQVTGVLQAVPTLLRGQQSDGVIYDDVNFQEPSREDATPAIVTKDALLVPSPLRLDQAVVAGGVKMKWQGLPIQTSTPEAAGKAAETTTP